ncbi:MAG: cell division FtsZ family protein [Alloprevotella sp.]|nr:cell division FtsZ family protein [Alloprevotella sp.]
MDTKMKKKGAASDVSELLEPADLPEVRNSAVPHRVPTDGEPLLEPVDFGKPEPDKLIKVIGVGGGGCNAVANMYAQGIKGVSCLISNSDAKSLETHGAVPSLSLGTMGWGGNVQKGREETEKQVAAIQHVLKDGTRMVIIATGLGGGTGTSAAPIFAREARKLGLLTVAIATLPYSWEGRPRIEAALDGLDRLAQEVDSLLVISNDRVQEVYGDKTAVEGYKLTDEVLCSAVRSIVEISLMFGYINLDFADISTTLRDSGVAIIADGYGEGEHRLTDAINAAVHSPLLDNKNLTAATHVLIRITCNPAEEHNLRFREYNQVGDFLRRFGPNTWVKHGLDFDDSLGDRVKVTILASGFGLYKTAEPDDSGQHNEERNKRISRFYPNLVPPVAPPANELPTIPGLEDEPEEEVEQGKDTVSEPTPVSTWRQVWDKLMDYARRLFEAED